MSRTYCGTALGGTTPDASTASGSICVAASRLTMSPELMVSAGRLAALKLPIFTVAGDGASVYSAGRAYCGATTITRPHSPAMMTLIGRPLNLARPATAGSEGQSTFTHAPALMHRLQPG